LGNGVSSSPSNSSIQPDSAFPVIKIADMVHAEYILVKEILNINHLYAAVGGSMGSMQLFQWLVQYPGFIDKAVPYVCTPSQSYYDLQNWMSELDIIETCHRYSVPEKDVLRMAESVSDNQAYSPEYIVRNKKAEKFAEDFAKKLNSIPNKVFTSYNRAAQLKAMIDHNIFKYTGNSMEDAAKIITAKVFMIVSSSDHLVNPSNSLKFAKILKADTLVLNNGGGHMAVSCDMKKCAGAIHKFLKTDSTKELK